MDYKSKYLKYKKKYLDLKDVNGGGMMPSFDMKMPSINMKIPDLGIKKALIPDKKPEPTLGILRLDYDYPPAPGDVDDIRTWNYKVIYRVIPKLTFGICQKGGDAITEEIKQNTREAVKYLEKQGVVGITGDCGFMINIQDIVNDSTNKPVFLTSLVGLPSITNAFDNNETIAVLTANSNSLDPILPRLLNMSGISEKNKQRLQIVGCQNVDGFDAVEKGEKVDVQRVTPGIVALVKKEIQANPKIKCILMECTELGPYSDSVRAATGLPVYDSITTANSFMEGFLDNKRFGSNYWQKGFSGQTPYKFGDNLTKEEKNELVNKIGEEPKGSKYGFVNEFNKVVR